MKKILFPLTILAISIFSCKKEEIPSTGVQVIMETPTYSNVIRSNGDIVGSTYIMPLTVKAGGQTVYVGQTAQYGATVSGMNGVAFGFNDAFAPNFLISSGPVAPGVSADGRLNSGDAPIENSAYRIDAGTTKHFSFTVFLQSVAPIPAPAIHHLRAVLNEFKTFTNSMLTTGGSVQNQSVFVKYFTDYKPISTN